jgi:hypothetical protein
MKELRLVKNDDNQLADSWFLNESPQSKEDSENTGLRTPTKQLNVYERVNQERKREKRSLLDKAESWFDKLRL